MVTGMVERCCERCIERILRSKIFYEILIEIFLINKLNLKFDYKYFTFINFLVTYFAKNKHRFFLKKKTKQKYKI
jgi:hypothetical protein